RSRKGRKGPYPGGFLAYRLSLARKYPALPTRMYQATLPTSVAEVRCRRPSAKRILPAVGVVIAVSLPPNDGEAGSHGGGLMAAQDSASHNVRYPILLKGMGVRQRPTT